MKVSIDYNYRFRDEQQNGASRYIEYSYTSNHGAVLHHLVQAFIIDEQDSSNLYPSILCIKMLTTFQNLSKNNRISSCEEITIV